MIKNGKRSFFIRGERKSEEVFIIFISHRKKKNNVQVNEINKKVVDEVCMKDDFSHVGIVFADEKKVVKKDIVFVDEAVLVNKQN